MIIPPTNAVTTKTSLNDVTRSLASCFIFLALATSTATTDFLPHELNFQLFLLMKKMKVMIKTASLVIRFCLSFIDTGFIDEYLLKQFFIFKH